MFYQKQLNFKALANSAEELQFLQSGVNAATYLGIKEPNQGLPQTASTYSTKPHPPT